jgi:hypothetical protein
MHNWLGIEDNLEIRNLDFDETEDALSLVTQDDLDAGEAELEAIGWLGLKALDADCTDNDEKLFNEIESIDILKKYGKQ